MLRTARMMIFSTARTAENHLLTSVPLPEDYVNALAEQCNVKVHYLFFKKTKNPAAHLSTLLEIKKTLKELRPDLVHVHGSWDWRLAAVERTARKMHIVTLLTPHNGLAQELLGIDFWNRKLPCLIAYQAWMVRNCTAVIAINEKEKGDVASLGLKRRIEVMPPVPKDGDRAEELCDALMTAYRKALDSTYEHDLTQKERDIVSAAVRADIADSDVATESPDVQGVSYRRIFFYAYDEDIMEAFVRGAAKLQIALPPTLDVAQVPRYRNVKAKQRGALKDANAAIKPISLPAERQAEGDAVRMIAKAQRISMPRLTLRHYAELYQMFRLTDFDEDVVMAELKRLHLTAFTKKLQKRLTTMFALKQGYDII